MIGVDYPAELVEPKLINSDDLVVVAVSLLAYFGEQVQKANDMVLINVAEYNQIEISAGGRNLFQFGF